MGFAEGHMEPTSEMLLLNPGPVPLAPNVLDAMAEPMVSHRSTAFENTFSRAQSELRYVFEQSSTTGEQTASGGTPVIMMGTATLAMEAAVASLVTPESEVVAVVNGKFGQRFVNIAERYAHVTPVSAPWGESIDLAAVSDAVSESTDLITVVHNETSTGILNPVEAIGEIAASNDARFIVDGVTSIGGDAFHLDAWGVDIAITDAQKALAAPPGISAIYLAEGVDEAIESEGPPFYGDLERYVAKASDHQTPFTSAVPLVRAMAEALDIIRTEGMAARIARHRRQSRAFREAFDAMGLQRFPTINSSSNLSNTVTAIDLPPEAAADPQSFFDAVLAEGVSISGGQAHLGGSIFRVSNMGNLDASDIDRGIRGIATGLEAVGRSVDRPAAREAARQVLAG